MRRGRAPEQSAEDPAEDACAIGGPPASRSGQATMSTSHRTVRQMLEELAEEHGKPSSDLVAALLGDRLESLLTPRYRRLAADVYLRLPDGWDSHADWTIVWATSRRAGVTYRWPRLDW